MKTFFSLFFVLIVVLSGCKPTEATITTYTHDSIRCETEVKKDSVAQNLIGEDLFWQLYIYCDSSNNAHMKAIDSLTLRTIVNAVIKNDTLYLKVKVKDYTYYKMYLFEKTLREITKNRITTKTVIQKIPNRLNHNLIISNLVTIILLILLYRYKNGK